MENDTQWMEQIPDTVRLVRITPFSKIDIIDFVEIFDSVHTNNNSL